MLRPSAAAVSAALVVSALLPLAPLARATVDGPPAAIARGQALLAKGDAAGAAAALESALVGADAATRPAIREALRTAYERAAEQAEAAGRTREAEHFRENLAILSRKPRPAAGAPTPPPAAALPPASAPPAAPPRPGAAQGIANPPAPKPPTVEPSVVVPDVPPNDPAPERPGKGTTRPASASPDPGPPSEPPAPLPLPPSDPAVERSSTETTAPTPSPAPRPAPPRPSTNPAPAGETPLFDPEELAKPPAVSAPPAARSGGAAATPGNRSAPADPDEPPSPLPIGDTPEPDEPAPARTKSDPEPTLPAESPEEENQPKAPTGLSEADAAFRKRSYEQAGTFYGALADSGALPENRKAVWAYCLRFTVVKRINAQPRDAAEWQAIAEEIAKIQGLDPKHWYDEYLMSLVKERSKGAANPAAPRRARTPAPGGAQSQTAGAGPQVSKVAVRGQSPTPPAAPGLMARPGTGAPPAVPAPAAVPSNDPDAGRWQVLNSTNFRVFHVDPALAEKVAGIAEATRTSQLQRWTATDPANRWFPVCEIYLYPSAREFSERTGQPEDSPGFSTSGLMAGRVTARRVNLRTDHPKMLAAILPHEVTHIVLAELFPEQQIPRWADEGMAVLSEPQDEQAGRAADLHAPLRGGKIFSVEQLMVMDYPEGKHWPLYYAQSISLTRFLVDQDSPVRFVEFVRDAQRHGFEAALRRHYQIQTYAELQERWIAYARSSSEGAPGVRTAAAEPADTDRVSQE